MTSFSDLLRGLQRDGDGFAISLPPDWLQGRTAYGGLSAALCLEATLRSFPDLPPLRSAQFCFVGPATGALRATAAVLRQGKSTAFISADLDGESGLAARATLAFGAERTPSLNHAEVPAPAGRSLTDSAPYYDWPGKPNFMNHFEGRLAAGAAPRTPGARPEMLVWVRHRDEAAAQGLVGLLALADALPPASTILFPEFAPISTMTWSLDVLDPAASTHDGWWLIHCLAETARQGYSAQHTRIWNTAGQPIIAARQTIAIFSKG
ncbi:MAG: thioesterase family protein [Pseudomonadota bacterium]|nr:thioesterase family protein [Pseudomonadota bacterium]